MSEARVCVGCGAFMYDEDHHCDPKREKAIEDARRSHGELGIERKQTFSERLADGFRWCEQ